MQVGVGEKRSRGGFVDYSEIDRPVNSQEMEQILSYAKQLGREEFNVLDLRGTVHRPGQRKIECQAGIVVVGTTGLPGPTKISLPYPSKMGARSVKTI